MRLHHRLAVLCSFLTLPQPPNAPGPYLQACKRGQSQVMFGQSAPSLTIASLLASLKGLSQDKVRCWRILAVEDPDLESSTAVMHPKGSPEGQGG